MPIAEIKITEIIFLRVRGCLYWEAGQDICRDGTFVGTGRLPGLDVFQSGLKGFLDGKIVCPILVYQQINYSKLDNILPFLAVW